MTDRIQELMETCWDPGRGVVNPRKLAYMVIKECAQVARKNQQENMNWDIADILLEHFGINT